MSINSAYNYCPHQYIEKPLLDYKSFVAECTPNKQGMIYGLNSCDYNKVAEWLTEQKREGNFNDLFSWAIGRSAHYDKLIYGDKQDNTSDNRVIKRINYGAVDYNIRAACKAGLVNIVIENCKRKKEGLPLIPIIFITGKDEIKLDENKIMDRSKISSVTNAEIRRAYKLCSDSSLSSDIQDVAKETFVFINLKTNEGNESSKFSFEKKPAPWESKEWAPLWEDRQKTAKPQAVDEKMKEFTWRNEVYKLLK